MKTKIANINNQNWNLVLHKAAYPIWGLLGIAMVFYIYFLGSTIFNVIGQSEYEKQARVLKSEIGQLELSYLGLSDSFNLPYARSIGLAEPKNTYFVGQTPSLAVLNLIAQNVVE